MLEIHLHDGSQSMLFRLVGSVTEPWAGELEQSWRTAASVAGDRVRIIDLTGVGAIDVQGESVLRNLAREGARFITASALTDALVQKISGRTPEPLPFRTASTWRRLLCRLARCCRQARAALAGSPCAELKRVFW